MRPTARPAKTIAAGKASGAPRPLQSNLSYRLSFTSFLMNRSTAPVLASHGLTTQQWKVLSVLAEIAPATAQAVTRRVTLDKSAVSRSVRSLLEQGLVTRRLHAIDARNVELSLTAKGARTCSSIAAEVAASQDEALQDLSPAAAGALFDALGLVEARLRARVGGAATGDWADDDA